MKGGECPLCGAHVLVESKAYLGKVLFCPECDAELEVINLSPLELDIPLDDDIEEYDDEYDVED